MQNTKRSSPTMLLHQLIDHIQTGYLSNLLQSHIVYLCKFVLTYGQTILTTKTSWHIGFDPNIGPFEENFDPFAIKFLWNRLGNKFSCRLLGTNGQKPTVCDENDTYIQSDQTMLCLTDLQKTNVFILHVECHLCGICHQSQTISLVISFDISLFVVC